MNEEILSSHRFAQRPTPILRTAIGALLFGQWLLVGHLLQLTEQWWWAGCVAAGGVFAIAAAYFGIPDSATGRRKACCLMLGAGGAGMLAGLAIDTGGAGLIPLLSWCQASPGLYSAVTLLTVTPATYILMAMTCSVAMWGWEAACRLKRVPDTVRPHALAMNFCMFIGMIIGHLLSSVWLSQLPLRTYGATMLGLMTLGMAVGLLVSYGVFSNAERMGWVKSLANE